MLQASRSNQDERERSVKIINGVREAFEYTDYRDMEVVGNHQFYPVINGSEIYVDVCIGNNGVEDVKVYSNEFDVDLLDIPYIKDEVKKMFDSHYEELKSEYENENWFEIEEYDRAFHEDMKFDLMRDRLL